jgi:hypothetical protein
MVFDALFNQQQSSQSESPYSRLLEDPKFALGYGLLTSRENPLGAALPILQQGEKARLARVNQKAMQEALSGVGGGGNNADKLAMLAVQTGNPQLMGMAQMLDRRKKLGKNAWGEEVIIDIGNGSVTPLEGNQSQPTYQPYGDETMLGGEGAPLIDGNITQTPLPPMNYPNTPAGQSARRNDEKINAANREKQPSLLGDNGSGELNYNFEGATGAVPYAKDALNYFGEVGSNIAKEFGYNFNGRYFDSKDQEKATINTLAGEYERALSPVSKNYGQKSSQEMQKRLGLRPAAGVEPSTQRAGWQAAIEAAKAKKENLMMQNEQSPTKERAEEINRLDDLLNRTYKAFNGLGKGQQQAPQNNQSAIPSGGRFLGFE